MYECEVEIVIVFDEEIKDLGYDYKTIMDCVKSHKTIRIGDSEYFVSQIDNVTKVDALGKISGGYNTYHLQRVWDYRKRAEK